MSMYSVDFYGNTCWYRGVVSNRWVVLLVECLSRSWEASKVTGKRVRFDSCRVMLLLWSFRFQTSRTDKGIDTVESFVFIGPFQHRLDEVFLRRTGHVRGGKLKYSMFGVEDLDESSNFIDSLNSSTVVVPLRWNFQSAPCLRGCASGVFIWSLFYS